MLVIRTAQMHIFRTAGARQFEREMSTHIARYFPNHFAILGEPAVNAVVQLGIAKAQANGRRAPRDICRLVNLMLMFGSHFDRDITLAWNEPLQRSSAHGLDDDTLDSLVKSAHVCFDTIAGERHVSINRMFLQVRDLLLEIKDNPVPADTEQDARALLTSAFARKAALVDEHILLAMIRLAKAKAARYAMETPQGIRLFLLLMFIAGADFDDDPQHSWSSRTLHDANGASSSVRVARLAQAAHRHVVRWIDRGTMQNVRFQVS